MDFSLESILSDEGANVATQEWRDSQTYLERQWRLLWEDFKEPLRKCLVQILDDQTHIDNAVHIGRVKVVSRDLQHQNLVFGLKADTDIVMNRGENEGSCVIPGCLVILRDRLNVKFGVLVERTEKDDGMFVMEPIGTFPETEVRYEMFSFSVYFEAYRHSLRVLQRQVCVPLEEYIVLRKENVKKSQLFKNDKIDITCLKKKSENKSSSKAMDLQSFYKTLFKREDLTSISDDSIIDMNDSELWSSLQASSMVQVDTVRKSLVQEMSLIQGPPGTGKTTTAVKIIEIIQNNKCNLKRRGETQILVLCYTNRGLDHLLEQLLDVTQKVVRLGGRSQSKLLESHNLTHIKMYMKEQQLRRQDWYQQEKELLRRQTELREQVSTIHMDKLVPGEILTEWKEVSEKIVKLRHLEDVSILRNADVVGMTVSRAARQRDLLELLRPAVVLVEEAAEILECHLVAALPSTTSHLIMLGDHKQLRPVLASHSLLSRDPTADMSMFERLIQEGMSFSRLDTQHRMAPNISALLAPIYPGLKDSETVQTIKPLPGLNRHVVFLEHCEREQGEGGRLTNQYEAEMVAGIVQLLIHHGVLECDMVILSPYSAQVSLIRSLVKDTVEVATVDTFQGQERDVVVLSLVRSGGPSVGFLTQECRAVVALSRARHGLVVVADIHTLAMESVLWAGIRDCVSHQGGLVSSLEMICSSHCNTVRIQSPEDFHESPLGGCCSPCDCILPCTHLCTLPCHPTSLPHQCTAPCQRTCPLGHPCPSPAAPCSHSCPPCQVQVSHTLSCGHTLEASCEKPVLVCTESVSQSLSCGHTVWTQCGRLGHCTHCLVSYKKHDTHIHHLGSTHNNKSNVIQVKLDTSTDSKLEPINIALKEDMMIQLQKGGSSPLSFLDWLRNSVSGSQEKDSSFIRVLVSALVCYIADTCHQDVETEKEKIQSYQQVLKSFTVNPELQLTVLHSIQETCFSYKLHRGFLLRWFMSLYEEDTVEEEVFLQWKEEVNPCYLGKGEALIQVNRWLQWLEQEEEDDDED